MDPDGPLNVMGTPNYGKELEAYKSKQHPPYPRSLTASFEALKLHFTESTIPN